MIRHDRILGIRWAALACAASLALPAPARADNCSGLSDCSAGVQMGLAVLAAALLVGAVLVAAELVAAAAAEAAAAELAAAELAAAEVGAAEAAAAEVAAAELAAAEAAAAEAAAVAAPELSALEAAVAEGGVQPLPAGLADLNGIGGSINCAQCVEAVEAYFGGASGALPHFAADIAPTLETMGELEATLGNGAAWADMSLPAIGETLESAGVGARGVLYIDAGGPMAHVLNVVNIGGEVVGIDAQIGLLGPLADLLPGGLSRIMFLPTFFP